MLAVWSGEQGQKIAYRHHGQQNVPSRCRLHGRDAAVNQVVDRRRGTDQPDSQVTNDGDMVGLGAVGGDDEEDAEDEEEVEDEGEPGVRWPDDVVVWILVPIAKDGSKEDDDPCQLVTDVSS